MRTDGLKVEAGYRLQQLAQDRYVLRRSYRTGRTFELRADMSLSEQQERLDNETARFGEA